MKLLFYGESPLNPTGFGHVNKHLLSACARVADVTAVCSTHYHETYDQHEYPYEIIGCDYVPVEQRDLMHQSNRPKIQAALQSLDWDVFFYQGDMGWNNDILEMVGQIQKDHPEKNSIFYMPIDGDVSLDFAFTPFTWCTVPVVYTYHARRVIEKYAPDVAKNTSVIWLGCETDVFYPLSPEEKKACRIKFFGEHMVDRFLVINVNRNQPRKDLARSMALFHQFHQKHEDSSLYMHSVQVDAGGSLPFQARMVGMDIYKSPAEIIFSGLNLASPWSRETLNELYNSVDCLISTSYGEGWGLTTTEAMSAGIPVLVPYNTANMDILGNPVCVALRDGEYERGWGARSGGDLDHTTFIYQNGATTASVVHSDNFISSLETIYAQRAYAQLKAHAAVAWCRDNTWQRREEEWEQLLRMLKSQYNG